MAFVQFLQDLFMLKYLPDLSMNASYGLLFIIGLLTSFHCLGMCGGIVLSQTIGDENVDRLNSEDQINREEHLNGDVKKQPWFIPSAKYNLGRVIAYTFVGGLVGGLGQIISFTGVWKGIIPILGGVFMVIMGINLLGAFPILRRLNIRMPYFAAKKIMGNTKRTPFYIGLLTGLMPCGPLQIVQLYALGTGSILNGALSMLVFSLGTVPMLFALGGLNTIINKKQTKYILKISAILVIILGLIMIGRGLALSGIQAGSSTEPTMTVSQETGVAKIKDVTQFVETAIGTDNYPPIVVQKGIPVSWTIHVKAENLNTCNEAIIIQQYGIEKDLVVGDNIVEFIPVDEGEFIYTCWMGMIKSKITVVEDLGAVRK
jgi:sulfite exporter TauE/SafE